MKMYGSSLHDTLIGTTLADTIYGNGGDDLISTGGGRDKLYGGLGNDLMTGFSVNLRSPGRSASLGAEVDGGGGWDAMIVEVNPAGRTTYVEDVAQIVSIKGVEDMIYAFGTLTQKQLISGSKDGETIVVRGGSARVQSMNGNDYIFTGDGNDRIDGGNNDDFLAAGSGHNTVTGGAGSDTFMFNLNGTYQYTEITDFDTTKDKIAVVIAKDQFMLANGLDDWPDYEPEHLYGDRYQGVGNEINDFVTYNNQRLFDNNDDTFGNDVSHYDNFVTYDQSTGSILLAVYVEVDEVLVRRDLHVAHVDGEKNLQMSDFVFLVM